MIIIGVDPGFANIGIGVLELERSVTRVVHHETFVTTTRDGEAEERLDAIAEHLLDVCEQFDPAAIGYENQAGFAVAAARGDEGGPGINAAARRLGEVTGIIRCVARCYSLPCYCIAPSSVKVAVLGKGGGRAPKERMKRAVREIFKVGRCSEHAADAIAIAVGTGVRHRRAMLTQSEHASLIH